MSYLDGENIKPNTVKEGKALIGRSVRYLRKQDVDHSGRGYFWTQTGTVLGCYNRNLEIGERHNYVAFSEIVEMVAA